MSNGKLSYLKTYRNELEIVTEGIEELEILPQMWKDILGKPTAKERCESALAMWYEYEKVELRNTVQYLHENLVDVELIRYNSFINQKSVYSLLYSVSGYDGDILYYEGGNPKQLYLPEKLAQYWDEFPKKLTAFYEHLHNGFFYYASMSNGLSPADDVLHFEEVDWGILDDLEKPLQICMEKSFGFFNNGGSGYIAIDASHCKNEEAAIWFSNDQPTYGLNFWDALDEWIVMGME